MGIVGHPPVGFAIFWAPRRGGRGGCAPKPKPRGKAAARGGVAVPRKVNHAAKICDVLTKMTPGMRKEVIHERVTQKQRVALEKEMIARKRAKATRDTTTSAVQALC